MQGASLWHECMIYKPHGTCLAFSYFYKVQRFSFFLFSNRLSTPNPRTYIGSGKVSEIRTAIQALDVETVIFDDELSPGYDSHLLLCYMIQSVFLVCHISDPSNEPNCLIFTLC